MAPKKNVKATKKFEKKHLKGVLERRKATAKIKQRVQLKQKKQAKRKDADYFKGDGASAPPKTNGKRPDANVSSMSVDDFFQGGFEIIDKTPSGKKSKAKLGKRKRDEPEADEDESDSGSEPASGGSEDGSADGDVDLVGMSKDAMDALQEKDPEFYQFLKENDPEALDFDLNADLAEVDELSASDEEQPKKKRKKEKKPSREDDVFARSNDLTRDMVAGWKKALEERHSLRAARQVVLAFRCAAHLNEADSSSQTFSISSPDVFHDVLVVALKQVPGVLQHHVPVKESASHKVYVSTDSKKFRALSMLIKSFTASVLHLLTTLSDDATLKLTLSALEPLLPYLLSYRKLLKHLIKSVVNFWAQPASSDSTRITAFLVLRRLVTIGDKGIRETVLKASYQGLIQGSRKTNANTLRGINLMKNSAAELWGIDQSIGYTTAFAFIRQLAIHLRNSIVHNGNQSYKNVYNWQYVHSLDFWSCVLAEHCSSLKEAEAGGESQLRLLVYPLVQVTLGAMRLIPTAAYFPLRFHLVRSLLRVSRATGAYIPLASALLEVLSSAEMKKPAKPSTLKQLDFATAYKAPKAYLRTGTYQTAAGEQVVELLAEFFVLWATNVAFPEFALPVVVALKRWLKDARRRGSGSKNAKVTGGLALLVQKLEANAKFIEEKRAKVDFAPQDRSQVEAFLKDFEWEKTPVGAFVVGQRALRAERARVVEQARKDEDRKRREDEKAALAERAEREDAVESAEDDDDDDGSGGEELEDEDEEMEDEDE